jgi:hypothetical protein
MIGQSLWFYCERHKVKWLAGWDLSHADETDAEQQRRYDEIGLDVFEYLGPDAEGYKSFIEKHRH